MSNMRKRCTKCGKNRLLKQFRKDARFKDGLHYRCRVCVREYARAHHKKNPQSHRKAMRAMQLRKRSAVLEYLKTHPCVDCGEDDPIVLDFDHVRGNKTMDVSRMLSRSRPLPVIFKEIAKCVVRCAHCHRRKTARQRGYYSWVLLQR